MCNTLGPSVHVHCSWPRNLLLLLILSTSVDDVMPWSNRHIFFAFVNWLVLLWQIFMCMSSLHNLMLQTLSCIHQRRFYSVTIVFFFPTRMVMNELDLLQTTLVSKNDVNLANFNCNQHDFKKEMRGKMKWHRSSPILKGATQMPLEVVPVTSLKDLSTQCSRYGTTPSYYSRPVSANNW